MIASLRNGFADGLTVTRHHRAFSKVQCRPRQIHLSSRTPDGLSWRLSGSVALYSRTHSRFISNAPRPPTAAPAKDIPPPVSTSPPRKPKLDLRPAPVKSSKAPTESTSTPPSSTSASTASESSTQAATSSKSSHAPLEQHSIIETAKEDMYDASKHGILAPPPENASWIRRIIHQGKELFKFYWNGVKLINTHRLRVRAIEARVKDGGAPISRWESRFIANYKQDALKLIPFALIVIIAEEVIPLVVIYAPFILPSTCLLPSQKERIDTKRRDKQRSFAESMSTVFQEVHERATSEPELSLDKLLDRTAQLSFTGILSLSTFGPPNRRISRIKKHLKAIGADDALLARENWGERLTALELRDALEERGIVAEGLTTDEMRTRLQWWLAGSVESSADPIRQRLLLVAANAMGKHD